MNLAASIVQPGYTSTFYLSMRALFFLFPMKLYTVRTLTHPGRPALMIVSDISGTEITFLRHKLTIENLKKRWGEIESDDQLQDAIAEYRMWRDERVEVCRICRDEPRSLHLYNCE